MRSDPIAAEEERATRGKEAEEHRSLQQRLVIKLPFRQHREYASISILLVCSRIRSRCRVVVRTLLQPSIRQRAVRLTTFCIELHPLQCTRCAYNSSLSLYPSLPLSRDATLLEIVDLFLRRREIFFSSDHYFFLSYLCSFVSDSPISAIDYFLRR